PPFASFAPRFGFAWQPGGNQGRVAVRGGYGWFYQPLAERGNAQGTPSTNVQPFAQLISRSGAANSASTLQTPFPPITLGFELRTLSSSLGDRIIGRSFRVPKLQQWNRNVRYAISDNFSLDLGYVGSHGNDLFLFTASNQPQLATPGHPVNCWLPATPAALGVTPAVFATLGVDGSGCVTTSTSANAYLRVPIVGESPTALLAHQYLGRSWYHSMQATLRQKSSL